MHQEQYYNLLIKHKHMPEDIELQLYYRSMKHYVFVFKLVNDTVKFNRKQTYFFIRKSFQEVEELSKDNHKAIISHDQLVYMVMYNDQLGSGENINDKYLEPIQFNKLVEQQSKENQEHHINLTFETLYDMRMRCEFMPFIYQEKKSLASHHMLVLDINAM